MPTLDSGECEDFFRAEREIPFRFLLPRILFGWLDGLRSEADSNKQASSSPLLCLQPKKKTLSSSSTFYNLPPTKNVETGAATTRRGGKNKRLCKKMAVCFSEKTLSPWDKNIWCEFFTKYDPRLYEYLSYFWTETFIFVLMMAYREHFERYFNFTMEKIVQYFTFSRICMFLANPSRGIYRCHL